MLELMSSSHRIGDIESLVSSLPVSDRALVERLYSIAVSTGRTRPPAAMQPWIEERFGDLGPVLEQTIVRITNRVTLEEALFNPLRSKRPIEMGPANPGLKPETDILADPLRHTPEDVFGRVRGKYCVTAGNVAKYDALHGIVVFDEPDPLSFNRAQLEDYLDTALRWADEAEAHDPEARYLFFMWNCGARAGASLAHGHAQVVLGRGSHYGRVEHIRRCALGYRRETGAEYFEDLCQAHELLGCGFARGSVRVLSHLTPVKEKEVIVVSDDLSSEFKDLLHDVLACFRDRMGVNSFNLAMLMPPLSETQEDWGNFPVMARIVDRGDGDADPSDIGTMELYAANVISSDPSEVCGIVRHALSGAAP